MTTAPPADLGLRFLDVASERRDAVALVASDGTSTSYGRLRDDAAALAAALVARDIAPGSVVGVAASDRAAFVRGTLGVTLAGGTYLPVDVDLPAPTLAAMLEDADAELVVADAGADGHCRYTGATTVPINGHVAPDFTPSGGAATAYRIYTSGSTGRPKGVEIAASSVVNLVVGCDYVRLDSGCVVGQASHPCFDAMTFELWGALLNGATLVTIGPQRVSSVGSILRGVAGARPTVLFLTTAYVNLLTAKRSRELIRVDQLLFGGEAASPAVAVALRKLHPGRLLNVYGPTETTTFTTYHELTDQHYESSVPIGRPLRGVAVAVVDSATDEPVVEGAGELLIGGLGVGLGYFNDPELDAQRFLRTPDGEHFFRSGDLVRRLPDGELDFVGRADAQVKVRGFRLDLDEIEAIVRAQDCVEDAVAAVRDDRVVVQLIVNQRHVPAVREFVSSRLPRYARPSAYLPVSELPLNRNGKVDRKAVREELRSP